MKGFFIKKKWTASLGGMSQLWRGGLEKPKSDEFFEGGRTKRSKIKGT